MAHVRLLDLNYSFKGNWKGVCGTQGFTYPGIAFSSIPAWLSYSTDGTANIYQSILYTGSAAPNVPLYPVTPSNIADPGTQRVRSEWSRASSISLSCNITQTDKVLTIYVYNDAVDPYTFTISAVDVLASTTLYTSSPITLNTNEGINIKFESYGDIRYDMAVSSGTAHFNAIYLDAFILSQSSLPLFLQGGQNDTSDQGDSLDLFLQGIEYGNQDRYDTLDLFLMSDIGGTPLNLFLDGSGSGSDTSSGAGLNLIIGDKGISQQNSLDLILIGSSGSGEQSLTTLSLAQLGSLTLDGLSTLLVQPSNENSGVYGSNTVNLYIRGEGEFDGFFADRSTLNLYMEGPPGAEKELSLFLSGSEPVTDSLDLFLSGTYFEGTGMNLYIDGKYIPDSFLPLFLRGYGTGNHWENKCP